MVVGVLNGPLEAHKWAAGQKRGFEIKLKVSRGVIHLGERKTTLPNKAGTVLGSVQR